MSAPEKHFCASYFYQPVFKVHHWLSAETYEIVVFMGNKRSVPKDKEAKKNAIKALGIRPDAPGLIDVVFIEAALYPDDNIERVYQKFMTYIPSLASKKGGAKLYAWVKRQTTTASNAFSQAFLRNLFRDRLLIPTEEFTSAFRHLFGKRFQHTSGLPDTRTTVDTLTALTALGRQSSASLSTILQPLGLQFKHRGFDTFPPVDLIKHTGPIIGDVIVEKTLLLESYAPIKHNTIYLVDKNAIGKAPASYFVGDYDFQTKPWKGDYVMQYDRLIRGIMDAHKVFELNKSLDVKCRLQYLQVRCQESATLSTSWLQLHDVFQQFETNSRVPFVLYYQPVKECLIKVHKLSMQQEENTASIMSLSVDQLANWLDFKKHRLERPEPYLLFKLNAEDLGLFITFILFESGSYDVKLYASPEKTLLFRQADSIFEHAHQLLKRLNKLPSVQKQLSVEDLSTKLIQDTLFIPRMCRIVNMNTVESCNIKYASFFSASHLANILKKMYPFFTVVSAGGDRLQIVYKRVPLFGRPGDITTFINKHRNLEHEDLVQEIKKHFNVSEDDAREQFEIWASSQGNNFVPWFRRAPSSIQVNIRIFGNTQVRWWCNGMISLAQHKRLLTLLKVALHLSTHYATVEDIHSVIPSFSTVANPAPLEEALHSNREDDENDFDYDDGTGGNNSFLDMLMQEEGALSVPNNASTTNNEGEGKAKESAALKELQMADPELFSYSAERGWSSSCGASTARQPVVVTPEELENIKEADTKRGLGHSIVTSIAYGSTPQRAARNRFICPEVWCPQSRISLTHEQMKSLGGPTKACPLTGEVPIAVEKNYWINSKTKAWKPRFIGFLSSTKHPSNKFCLPCCFTTADKRLRDCKVQPIVINKEIWEKKAKKSKAKADEEEDGDDDNNNVVKLVATDLEVDRTQNQTYVLENIPVAQNRYGLLPPSLGQFLGNHLCGLHEPSMRHVDTVGASCFLRRGIDMKSAQPFLEAIIHLLYENHPTMKTVDDVLKVMQQHITPQVFVMLNGGHAVQDYMPKNIEQLAWNDGQFKKFKAWFLHNDRQMYRTLFNLSAVTFEIQHKAQFPFGSSLEDLLLREFGLYQAYHNFQQMLRDPSITKTHNMLLDLFNLRDPTVASVFNPNGVQILLLEADAKTNNVTIECPTYRHLSEFIDSHKPVALLFKQGAFYEPINKVIKLTSQWTANRIYMVSQEPILNLLLKYLKTTASQYAKTEVGRPIAPTLRAYLKSSTAHGFKSFVIDANMRTIGLLTASDIYLPLPTQENLVLPAINSQETVVPIEYVLTRKLEAKPLTRGSVVKLLEELNEWAASTKLIKKGFLFAPVKTAAENSKVVMLEDQRFIPLQPLVSTHPEDIPMLEPWIDARNKWLGKQVTDARMSTIEEHRRDAHLYNLYKAELLRLIPYHSQLLSDLQLLWHPMHPYPEELKKHLIRRLLLKLQRRVVLESALMVTPSTMKGKKQMCSAQVDKKNCQDTLYCTWIDIMKNRNIKGKGPTLVRVGAQCRLRAPKTKTPSLMKRLVDEIWSAKSIYALKAMSYDLAAEFSNGDDQSEEQLLIVLPMAAPSDPNQVRAILRRNLEDNMRARILILDDRDASALADKVEDKNRAPANITRGSPVWISESVNAELLVVPQNIQKVVGGAYVYVVPDRAQYQNDMFIDMFVKGCKRAYGKKYGWTLASLKAALMSALLKNAETVLGNGATSNEGFEEIRKTLFRDGVPPNQLLTQILHHPNYRFGKTELKYLARLTHMQVMLIQRVNQKLKQDFLGCLWSQPENPSKAMLLFQHVHAREDKCDYYYPVIKVANPKAPTLVSAVWMHDKQTLPPAFVALTNLKCTELRNLSKT